MEKVKVNKEIFNALNDLMKTEKYDYGNKKSYFIRKKAFKSFPEEMRVLNAMDDLEFSKCIIFGYELEGNKEDKLLKQYNYLNKKEASLFNLWKAEGILETLEILEIKIDGINK